MLTSLLVAWNRGYRQIVVENDNKEMMDALNDQTRRARKIQ